MLNRVDPRAAPWRLPGHLASAMSEAETVILMIFGAGPGPERTERRCRSLADDPGFEALRVVRIEDQASLVGVLPAAWMHPGLGATLVAPDRRLAVPLDPSDGVALFVAVSALARPPARRWADAPHALATGGG